MQVCGQRFRRTAATQTLIPIFIACGVNVKQPTTYTLVYTVTNSAGFTSNITRQLTILSSCLPGEVLCNDLVSPARLVSSSPRAAPGLRRAQQNLHVLPAHFALQKSCSERGICTKDLNETVSTARVVANQAPVVTLITSDALGQLVELKRGASYS